MFITFVSFCFAFLLPYPLSPSSPLFFVTQQVGIDQGDSPDLTQAPSSLLEALEQHLASLEGRKIKELSAASSTGISLSRVDDKMDDNRLQQHKDEGPKVIDIQTPNVSPGAQSVGSANSSGGAADLFSNSPVVPVNNHVPNLTSELFTLQQSFTPIQTTHTVPNNNNAWGGDLLKPAPPTQIHSHGALLHSGKMLPNDLDSSLANLVGNLQFGGTTAKKPELQWSQLVEKKPTGGGGWQSKTMCANTNWTHATHHMAPAPMPVPQMNGMIYTGYAPAPVAFPMTTPQVPVYGMLPAQVGHQMGGVPMMAPQPVMYNQPVLRPTNPFGPIPGTQVMHGHAHAHSRSTHTSMQLPATENKKKPSHQARTRNKIQEFSRKT